jgi:vitamin B12 transporter
LLTNTIQKDKWDITPGVEYEEFEGSFDNRGQYYSASVDTGGENIGYFVNGNMIVSDKLLLSAGVRQDDPSLFGDYTTYRLGGTYDLTGALQLKGNYATSVKTPTLYEMHGSDNYGYNGNPNLLPEEAVSTDLGFEFKFKESVLDFVYFSTDLDNLITYGNSTYSNASGKSNRHGAELKFNTLVSENIYWRTNATFTIAEDGNGTQVLRRPKWTGLTAVDYKKDSWTTTAEYLHTGSHLDIDSATYATITKPSVGVANFHTNYEINENSNVIFSLNNAFDKTYERPDGYAQDGRNILLTYKLKF